MKSCASTPSAARTSSSWTTCGRKERPSPKSGKKPQERGRALRGEIQTLEEEAKKLDEQLEELLLQVPNIPQPDVPLGKDDSGKRDHAHLGRAEKVRLSRPRRTGSWAKTWASSTSSAG